MIDTYKIRNVLEMLVFILINILFSDLFVVVYCAICFLVGILFSAFVESYPSLFWLLAFGVVVVILLILRYFGLIILYYIFEQNVQNKKITDFIRNLKENKKLQLKVWLLTWLSASFIPILCLVDSFISKEIDFKEILIAFIFGVICLTCLAFNSFAALFYYWKVSDNNKHKDNVGDE